MAWWLFKTEPDTYSLDDLARDGTTPWEGIRNYQARNRLRDQVRHGDRVFIYHSSCRVPAIVGLAEVVGAARPDPTQFQPDTPGHDPRSSIEAPRWVLVDVRFLERFPRPLSLADIKADPSLAGMELVRQGRLSVQVVEPIVARQLLQRLR